MINFYGNKIVKIVVKKYLEIFLFFFMLLNIEILGKLLFLFYIL